MPTVPATVTVNVPDVADAVQDSVEAPVGAMDVNVMLVGVRLQVRPAEGEMVADRLRVPANPSRLVAVTEVVPGVPGNTRTLVGFALSVKSSTVYVTLAVWLRLDPVPVTVTVYNPTVPEHDRVEVPIVVIVLSAKLVGDKLQVKPVGGDTNAVIETVPVKPLRPLSVMVEVPEEPDATVRLAGLPAMSKSWTV